MPTSPPFSFYPSIPVSQCTLAYLTYPGFLYPTNHFSTTSSLSLLKNPNFGFSRTSSIQVPTLYLYKYVGSSFKIPLHEFLTLIYISTSTKNIYRYFKKIYMHNMIKFIVAKIVLKLGL